MDRIGEPGATTVQEQIESDRAKNNEFLDEKTKTWEKVYPNGDKKLKPEGVGTEYSRLDGGVGQPVSKATYDSDIKKAEEKVKSATGDQKVAAQKELEALKERSVLLDPGGFVLRDSQGRTLPGSVTFALEYMRGDPSFPPAGSGTAVNTSALKQFVAQLGHHIKILEEARTDLQSHQRIAAGAFPTAVALVKKIQNKKGELEEGIGDTVIVLKNIVEAMEKIISNYKTTEEMNKDEGGYFATLARDLKSGIPNIVATAGK